MEHCSFPCSWKWKLNKCLTVQGSASGRTLNILIGQISSSLNPRWISGQFPNWKHPFQLETTHDIVEAWYSWPFPVSSFLTKAKAFARALGFCCESITNGRQLLHLCLTTIGHELLAKDYNKPKWHQYSGFGWISGFSAWSDYKGAFWDWKVTSERVEEDSLLWKTQTKETEWHFHRNVIDFILLFIQSSSLLGHK